MPKIHLTVEFHPISLQTDTTSSTLSHNQIRLIGRVVFLKKQRRSLSKPYRAIIDTGAPISVIPYSIWKDIDTVKHCQRYLGGINPEEQCKILCDLSAVSLQLVDHQKNRSPNFVCLAYLVPAKYPSVPLILGYDRCLENFRLNADIPNRQASLNVN